jgi:hypothetical protein
VSEATTDAQADFDDALARAFAQIEGAKKDTKGARSKYASLAATTDAIRAALTKEHFSWPQLVTMSDGAVIVTTQLRRKGVYIESVLPMPLGKNADAQAVGSAITYGRRYALAAITGVAPEDDDGEAAKASGAGPVQSPRSRQCPAEQKPGGWRASLSKEAAQAEAGCRAMVKERIELIRELGVSREAMEHSTTALLAEILDIEASAGGYDAMAPRFSLEQWGKVNATLRADIASLQDTKAQREEAGK